jgi:hypothetical protein
VHGINSVDENEIIYEPRTRIVADEKNAMSDTLGFAIWFALIVYGILIVIGNHL